MRRTHQRMSQRDGSRKRPEGHNRPWFLVLSANPDGPSGASISAFGGAGQEKTKLRPNQADIQISSTTRKMLMTKLAKVSRKAGNPRAM